MPSITWVLMLVVTLASGEVEYTVLANPPFTTISACAIAAGLLYRRGVEISKGAKEARMACAQQVRY